MSDELDRLVFALDADGAPYKAKLAGIEAETTASATRIGNKWKSTFDIINQNTGVDRIFKSAEDSASAFSNAMGDTAKSAQRLAAIARGELAPAVAAAHGSASTATREFRALFDELSSGRTRQTPGTLAIIASRVFGVSGATLAWGAALAAIPALMVAAALSAENAIGRISRAIASTGGASGQTVGGALDLASQLDGSTSMSFRNSEDVLAILNAHGNIPARLQGAAASDVPGFAAATGTSLDDAAKKLEEIFADPAKGAEELHKDFQMLSAAELQTIQDLEKRGQSERALQLLIDATGERFKGLEKPITALGGILDVLGKGASKVWSWMGVGAEYVANTATGGRTSDEARFAYLRSRQNRTPSEDQEYYSLQDKQTGKAVSAQVAAQQAAAKKQMDDSILGASQVADRYDVAGTKAKEWSQSLAELRAGLAAVNKELAADPTNKALLSDKAHFQAGIVGIGKEQSDQGETLAKQNDLAQRMADEARTRLADAIKEPLRKGNEDQNTIMKQGFGMTALDARSVTNGVDERNAGTFAGMDLSSKLQAQINARQQSLNLSQEQLQVDELIASTNGEMDAALQAKLHAQADELDQLHQQAEQTKQMADGLADSLTNAVDGALKGKKPGDIFRDLEESIVGVIEKTLILIPLEKALQQAMQGSDPTQGGLVTPENPGIPGGGGGGIGSIFNSLFGSGGGASAGGSSGGGIGDFLSSIGDAIGLKDGGAFKGGIRFAAAGMVLNGPTLFNTGSGPVVGGEMGDEALVPLARGPDGKLGIRSSGSSGRTVHINQVISVSPDVSAVARAEMAKQYPQIGAYAVAAVKQAAQRGG